MLSAHPDISSSMPSSICRASNRLRARSVASMNFVLYRCLASQSSIDKQSYHTERAY